MLRNASKRSAVPPGSGTIHRASRTTYRPHGDTQEPLRCQPTPVRAIVKQPPLPLDLFRPPANPCKTLQSASICFILLCRDLTHFATKCSELFHFVSFTPVHLRDAAEPLSVPHNNFNTTEQKIRRGGHRFDPCRAHHPVSANRTFPIRRQIGRFCGDFRPLISRIFVSVGAHPLWRRFLAPCLCIQKFRSWRPVLKRR